MTEKLTREDLKQYVGTNIKGYERCRDEFNEKGHVLSWSFAAFFFAVPWLIYRKLWLLLLIVTPFTFIFFVLLLGKISHTYVPIPFLGGSISPNSSIWLVFIVLLFTISTTLAVMANNAVLLKAVKYKGKNRKGKIHKGIAFVLSTVLYIPSAYVLYNISIEAFYYSSVQGNKDLTSYYGHYSKNEPFSGLLSYEKDSITRSAKDISSGFVKVDNYVYGKAYKIKKWFVCFNNVDFIKIFESKGLELNKVHLDASKQCNAKESQIYIEQKLLPQGK